MRHFVEIKTFSKRSFNYSFNSFNSIGVILYGRIEIGRVSIKISILKYMYRSEETPKSSGKTSDTLFLIELTE